MIDRVELRAYPVVLGMSVVEHVDDWMREFALMSVDARSLSDIPGRLQAMVEQVSQRYAQELSEPDRLRADAAARGDATVDLFYPVRPETEQVVLGWQQMLAEVDEYCRGQDLLTLERTPEQVLLNEWVFGEFLRQIAGEPPLAWAEWRAAQA